MSKRSKTPIPPEIVVLISGGLDSAVCLDFYLEFGRPVCAFFVDYGQPARQQELEAAQNVSNHYGVLLSTTSWLGLVTKNQGEIPARNAFFLTAALMERPLSASSIALGIHSGTGYSDSTPAFVQQMQGLFDLYTGGYVHVAAPLLEWTKSEIWSHAKSREVPIHLTYSCEAGGDPPCGRCTSCRDRINLA